MAHNPTPQRPPNVRRYEPSLRALGLPEHRAPRVPYRLTRINPDNLGSEAELRAAMRADAAVQRQRNAPPPAPDVSPDLLAARAKRNAEYRSRRARARAREALR